jgi:hypothetical protein
VANMAGLPKRFYLSSANEALLTKRHYRSR